MRLLRLRISPPAASHFETAEMPKTPRSAFTYHLPFQLTKYDVPLECSSPILKQYKNWAKTRTPEIVGENIHSPWKKTIMRKKRIEKVWIEGDVTPLELVGHDDHVVTCLQFDGQRIVSGSDDSTLKVRLILKLGFNC